MKTALSLEQAKDVLRTFNAKLDKIFGYSFFKHPKFSLSVDHDFVTHTATVVSDYPCDEAIDAVILNLRFFTLEREFSSYRMIKSVYAVVCPSLDLQLEFDTAYAEWGYWNTAASSIGQTTNERLFEIIFYGERAHRNRPANYLVYDEWKRNVLLFEPAMVAFCWKIDELVRILRSIYVVNQKVLS